MQNLAQRKHQHLVLLNRRIFMLLNTIGTKECWRCCTPTSVPSAIDQCIDSLIYPHSGLLQPPMPAMPAMLEERSLQAQFILVRRPWEPIILRRSDGWIAATHFFLRTSQLTMRQYRLLPNCIMCIVAPSLLVSAYCRRSDCHRSDCHRSN